MSREIWSKVCFHGNQYQGQTSVCFPRVKKDGYRAGLWALALWSIWFQEGFLISAYTVVATQKLWWPTRANSYFSALALPLSYDCAMSPLGLAWLGFMPGCCVR